MAAWERADEEAAYRYLSLSSERQEICDWMEGRGIWHMPLKGSLVCDLYPSPHLRECCDVDILFDTAHRNEVRAYMEERGYSFSSTYDHHDAYLKPPLYNFEMHRRLVHRSGDKLWVDYYENVQDWLLPVAGRSFELRFAREDFYVYMVLHAAQHMRKGGTGIRTLADFGVVLNAWGATMDWRKIDANIEVLGLAGRERLWRRLAAKLFSDSDRQLGLTADECMMLADMFVSGTYGDQETKMVQQVVNRQAEFGGLGRAKLAYVFRRLFPTYEEMSQYREGLQKRPWLLPLYWGKRIVGGLGRKVWCGELRQIADL